MQKRLATLLGILLLGICCRGFSQNDEMKNQCYVGHVIDNKYYVYPGTIYIAPEGIYLNINKDLIEISSVFSDKNGIYVTMEELRRVGRTWICSICYFENPSYLQWCQHCGNDRPKSNR